MTRYRTKPVYVEAEKFDPEDEEQMERWGVRKEIRSDGTPWYPIQDQKLGALPGYWLLRSIPDGDVRSCNPAFFAATYEEVQDGQQNEHDVE